MAKTSRRLTCSYLYSDGTLVQVYEEKRNSIKIGETVDITYGYCDVSVYESYEASRRWYPDGKPVGRIVIHDYKTDGFIKFAKGGRVVATAPSITGGSEASKRDGHRVQYVFLTTKQKFEFQWCDVPDIIGSRFTVQADANFTVKPDHRSGDSWGYDARVWKVTDLRPKPQPNAEGEQAA